MMLNEEEIKEEMENVEMSLQQQLSSVSDMQTENPNWLAGVIMGLKIAKQDKSLSKYRKEEE